MKRAHVVGFTIIATLLFAVLGFTSDAPAHPHHVTKGNGTEVVLANGQNHPGFTQVGGQAVSCEGTKVPADNGPAGYGLETAHHGPDQGKPGKGDGCYARDGGIPPDDNNPAID